MPNFKHNLASTRSHPSFENLLRENNAVSVVQRSVAVNGIISHTRPMFICVLPVYVPTYTHKCTLSQRWLRKRLSTRARRCRRNHNKCTTNELLTTISYYNYFPYSINLTFSIEHTIHMLRWLDFEVSCSCSLFMLLCLWFGAFDAFEWW